MRVSALLSVLVCFSAYANLPAKYTELLTYMQPAPDQGKTNTCLYVATTGAVELLLNKKYDVRNPVVGGRFDISERFALSMREAYSYTTWHTYVLPRFNFGWFIHVNDLPFNAYNSEGENNPTVWQIPKDFYHLPRRPLTEKFEFQKLFIRGDRYDRYVLHDEDIATVKKALVETQSPVLINYNDEGWWHAVLIVGYDDTVKGDCYTIDEIECEGIGAFIVRDSDPIGMKSPVRNYNWLRVNGNAALIVKLVK